MTAMMASATRALAMETFGINIQRRGGIDRFIAGDAMIAAAASCVSSARLARMALRTWIVDRWLLSVIGSCSQLVLMGAGLDTRSFCLSMPHVTRVFELDLPVVIGIKSHLLASSTPLCPVYYVPCDLTNPSWPQLLLNAGFQRHTTAWLLEGTAMCVLLPAPLPSPTVTPRARYLPPHAVTSILQRMQELCCSGSHLMLHSMPPPHPDHLAAAHVPYQFTASARDCVSLLQRTGWAPAPAITYASALADVQADPAIETHLARGLHDALSVAASSHDALASNFAPYFIPACT